MRPLIEIPEKKFQALMGLLDEAKKSDQITYMKILEVFTRRGLSASYATRLLYEIEDLGLIKRVRERNPVIYEVDVKSLEEMLLPVIKIKKEIRETNDPPAGESDPFFEKRISGGW
jgi:DNA-binding transcriptional ArsR family regulator